MSNRNLTIRLCTSWIAFFIFLGAIISGPATSWLLKMAFFLLFMGLRWDSPKFRVGEPVWLRNLIPIFTALTIGLAILVPRVPSQLAGATFLSHLAGIGATAFALPAIALSMYRDYLIASGKITKEQQAPEVHDSTT